MNTKINEHLFWSAINGTAPSMLRASAEIMGCFALLFYLLAIVYHKDSVDALFAGIHAVLENRHLSKKQFSSYFLAF